MNSSSNNSRPSWPVAHRHCVKAEVRGCAASMGLAEVENRWSSRHVVGRLTARLGPARNGETTSIIRLKLRQSGDISLRGGGTAMVVRSDWLVGGDRRHRGLRADLCRGHRCHCAWRTRGPRRRRVGRPGSLLARDDLPPCRRQGRDPRRGADPCRRPDHRDGAARGRRSERVRTDRHRDHGGAQGDSNRSARSADDHLDSRSGNDVAHRLSDRGRVRAPISTDSPTTIRRPRNGSSASCCP